MTAPIVWDSTRAEVVFLRPAVVAGDNPRLGRRFAKGQLWEREAERDTPKLVAARRKIITRAMRDYFLFRAAILATNTFPLGPDDHWEEGAL